MPPGVAQILRAWDIAAPTALERSAHGTNNTVWIVHTATARFILRLHQNATAERIAAEHRLLEALRDGGGLSFQIPLSMPTKLGQVVAATPLGPATLTPWIPGEHPKQDPPSLELIGAAVGELDAALARLPVELAPVDWGGWVSDIETLPGELARALPAEGLVRWFATRGPEIEAEARQWIRALPRQIVHGDCAMSNFLVDGGRVTGVLDFEIAGLDARPTDLVTLLLYGTDDFRADQVAALRRGYGRHVRLSDEDQRALPALVRFRALTSLVWRVRRWLAGQSTLDEVVERLRRGAAVDTAADTLA